ncbi:MAG: nucleotide exchange factor GrpE [Gammaproteobacteria bacterium]|nr:nucleotide exchange factor GrpE [Gammaproteobacteria bacterium]
MEKEQETTGQEAGVEELESGTDQPAAEGAETSPGDDQRESQEEWVLLLEDARNKADEHWNQLVRTRAEMDNLRKRQARELENAHKYALERFVNELLPVRDSMEMGLVAAAEEGGNVEKLREGAELTLKLLADVMAKFNVEQVDPLDQPFDPELHQAMAMVPREDVPPNTVVTVVQKGYTLNGRLVRPAMVMVSQGVA